MLGGCCIRCHGYYFQRSDSKGTVTLHYNLFLLIAVDPFGEDFISKNVLNRLIKQDVVVELSLAEEVNRPHVFLYKKGVMADYFVLILEGKVEVSIGQEEFTFDEGSFSCFGTKALVCSAAGAMPRGVPQYFPDYTVRAVSDLLYMKIPRAVYRQAVQATLMERQRGSDFGSDIFQDDPGQKNSLSDCLITNGTSVDRDSVYIETTC